MSPRRTYPLVEDEDRKHPSWCPVCGAVIGNRAVHEGTCSPLAPAQQFAAAEARTVLDAVQWAAVFAAAREALEEHLAAHPVRVSARDALVVALEAMEGACAYLSEPR